MGATVVVDKLVAGMTVADGSVLYVLFESTYERNVYPHTKRWSCSAFGPYEDVMEWIYLAASSCEGGTTQGPRGCISPETYLRGWQRAFEEVFEYERVPIELKVGSDFYASVPESASKAVKEACSEIGRSDISGGINIGVRLDPFTDHVVLTRLFSGRDRVLQVWRVFNLNYVGSLSRATLQPTVAAGCVNLPMPQVLRVTEDLVLIDAGDGLHRLEWSYRLVSEFVRATAFRAEMCAFGAGLRAIRRMREFVRSITDVPERTKVKVTVSVDGLSDHYAGQARAFATEMGLNSELVTSFEVEPAKFTSPNHFHYLSWLDSRQLAWRFDDDSVLLDAHVLGNFVDPQLGLDL